jgi:hypothetical protein
MTVCHYAECHCAKCRDLFIAMLYAIKLSVVASYKTWAEFSTLEVAA